MIEQLSMGVTSDVIARQARQTGHKVPEKIEKQTEIWPYLTFYWNAFFDLTFDRQLGFEEGPIPTTSILAYAKHHNLNRLEEEDLLFFIRRMDVAYLNHIRKRNARKKS